MFSCFLTSKLLPRRLFRLVYTRIESTRSIQVSSSHLHKEADLDETVP